MVVFVGKAVLTFPGDNFPFELELVPSAHKIVKGPGLLPDAPYHPDLKF